MQVNVTADGRLELIDDGVHFPPMTVEEIQFLANATPAAQNQVDLSQFIFQMSEPVKIFEDGQCHAVMSVQATTIFITADPPTFLKLAALISDDPYDSTTTTFTSGCVTVNRTGG